MRVALVVRAFPRRSETFIVSQFVGLCTRGVDAHVVCESIDRAAWRDFPELRGLEDRVHVAAAPTAADAALLRGSVAAGRSLARNVTQARSFLTRFRSTGGRPAQLVDAMRMSPLLDLRPDVVHFEFGVLARGRVAAVQSLGAAVVVSFRGYDLNFVGIEDTDHYNDVWQRADAFHFLGKDLHRRARRRGFAGQAPHRLIPPAVDLQRFRPERRDRVDVGSAERPVHLLSVGRLVWKKGHEFALQAVRELVDAGVDVRYRIVGTGPHMEALGFARHQLGLDEVVDLVGSVPSSEVPDHHDWADVMVHAAVSEGFGNAVMEAQAMELPVVCTDADGLAENVEHGRTGFVVPRRDVGAMAAAVARLAADPDLRLEMGRAGRARVAERFDPGRQIEAFVELYEVAMDAFRT